ncbi:methylated-DNA--[protein]-cysteine S-methyltransferase [Rhodoligotrophos defluvii]|uniref:methylated-DNA--[protein]-cysteine S-methyltransferase n=1 Tax=Rhodoligotrophos defluvii TaxID=2561934 RepID=UPI0010C988EC|nr:methylated-DNA--[protein]-cysteine S-methyltransferase [Rhodoligotrophos defluvii]
MPTAHALSRTGSLFEQDRPRDLFVTHDIVAPTLHGARGTGLTMSYGFHPTPFGMGLFVATGGGLSALGFTDEDGRDAALNDITRRWPQARFIEDSSATETYVGRVFDPEQWRETNPLNVVLIGTAFHVQVWEELLKIPVGETTNYSSIAMALGKPSASRAVGAAVGRNPISFVVPCHRVIGKGGGLCGYHWGLDRKRAMLSWEAELTRAGGAG